MRALISFLLIFTSLNALAFADTVTNEKTEILKLQLRSEPDKAKRLEIFENYRDFLFERLQTVELPKTPSEREGFRELNEFEANIFMIRLDGVTKMACVMNAKKITIANAMNRNFKDESDIKLPPAALETLEILKAICE